MLALLQDIAIDTELPLGSDNPLRQVIINTHSPLVVGECPDDALILARTVEDVSAGRVFSKVSFAGLDGTWRADLVAGRVSKGQLLSYLHPQSLRPIFPEMPQAGSGERRIRRVREREDLNQELFRFGALHVAEE